MPPRSSSRTTGGRQLDSVAATIDALPEVVDALALGARTVLAGRTPLYRLPVDGEAGAVRVLELLCAEILFALLLVDCARRTT